MHRTRVKICGITRSQDAAAAALAGADAVGMVLHAPSKRLISVEEAKPIVRILPPLVWAVGLFVDARVQDIIAAAGALGLAAVQLHGNESPEFVAALQPLAVIKAIPVRAATLEGELSRWRSNRPQNLVGLLLDTAGAGGSGIANDWAAIAGGDFSGLPPWIAAGGLTSAGVGAVVRQLRPWAVDVSSGVESRPREKSEERIRAFIRAVRQADGSS